MNYTDLQASIGRVQLARYEEFQFIRRSIAKIYFENLSVRFSGIRFQDLILSPRHALHLFVIQLPENISHSRENLILQLRNRNVGATIHYTPLHTMPLYNKGGDEIPALVQVDRLERKILTLPISASMSEEDAYYVVRQIEEVL
jgi:dTDP-4-amino-4,6-dideoxygalactose transaminase